MKEERHTLIDVVFLDLLRSQQPAIPTIFYFVLLSCFVSPFQVILMGFVCVTQFLLSCKRGEKFRCKIRFDALSTTVSFL